MGSETQRFWLEQIGGDQFHVFLGGGATTHLDVIRIERNKEVLLFDAIHNGVIDGAAFGHRVIAARHGINHDLLTAYGFWYHESQWHYSICFFPATDGDQNGVFDLKKITDEKGDLIVVEERILCTFGHHRDVRRVLSWRDGKWYMSPETRDGKFGNATELVPNGTTTSQSPPPERPLAPRLIPPRT
jgi:hypothetical protein